MQRPSLLSARLQAVAECFPFHHQPLIGHGTSQERLVGIQVSFAHKGECYGHRIAIRLTIREAERLEFLIQRHLPGFDTPLSIVYINEKAYPFLVRSDIERGRLLASEAIAVLIKPGGFFYRRGAVCLREKHEILLCRARTALFILCRDLHAVPARRQCPHVRRHKRLHRLCLALVAQSTFLALLIQGIYLVCHFHLHGLPVQVHRLHLDAFLLFAHHICVQSLQLQAEGLFAGRQSQFTLTGLSGTIGHIRRYLIDIIGMLRLVIGFCQPGTDIKLAIGIGLRFARKQFFRCPLPAEPRHFGTDDTVFHPSIAHRSTGIRLCLSRDTHRITHRIGFLVRVEPYLVSRPFVLVYLNHHRPVIT